MELSIAAFALLLTLGLVQASTQCVVTIPMQGTIWKTGSVVTIAWSGISTDTLPYITLAQSVGNNQYSDVAKLASAVPAGPGKFSIKLPANVITSSDYVLIIGDSTDILCHSGPLIVMNDGIAPIVDQISSHIDPVGTMRTANTLAPISTTIAPYIASGLGDPSGFPEATTSRTGQSLPGGSGANSAASMSEPVNGAIETKKSTSIGSFTEKSLFLTALVAIGVIVATF